MDAQKLLEQFNAEFPNGDSLELAQFVLAHASDVEPIETLQAHDIGDEEVIHITLSRSQFPLARQEKLNELMEQGAFNSKEEAERWIDQTPICLELYYEKEQGLFGVESEALDNCPIGYVVSPYTKKPIIIPGEYED